MRQCRKSKCKWSMQTKRGFWIHVEGFCFLKVSRLFSQKHSLNKPVSFILKPCLLLLSSTETNPPSACLGSIPEECRQCHAQADCLLGVGCLCKPGFQGNGTICTPEPRECCSLFKDTHHPNGGRAIIEEIRVLCSHRSKRKLW